MNQNQQQILPNDWEMVIGLEIHVRLDTNSKLFSGIKADYGAAPNTQVSLLDAALPGTLPTVNRKSIEYAIRFGLSIDAEIAQVTEFARKNYFYPDLPKGYQISQMDKPIIGKGRVVIDAENGKKTIEITRAHLEEDAGKSIHDHYPEQTAIDLNRAGMPLIEVVSEPQMNSAQQAVAYMRAIYNRVTHIGICDGNLQEGSFRCDANVSIRPKGELKLGTRTEIKNLNSFRFIEKAINYEAKRQFKKIQQGQSIQQQTRLYDSQADCTRSMRSKEDANDYRYFPDPDLLPIAITEQMIEQQRQLLPELPDDKFNRYQQQWSLKADDAKIIAYDKAMADFFEAAQVGTKTSAELNAKFLLGEFSALLNQQQSKIENSRITAEQYTELLDCLASGEISRKIAKQVIEQMWQSQASAKQIIDRQGLAQISDQSALQALVSKVLADHPDKVQQYLNGNQKMFNFFIGQIMQQTKGQANPVQTKQLLEEQLK